MAHLRRPSSMPRLSFLALLLGGVLPLLSCTGLAGGRGATGGLGVARVTLNEVYPVLFHSYDTYPLGTATLVNSGNADAKNITMSFFARQFMDAPRRCPAPTELARGASRAVDIHALFSPRVLQLTEATRGVGEIALEYSMNGRRYASSTTVTFRLQHRNAVSLTDVRRLAAFVTRGDPAVEGFARSVTGFLGGNTPKGLDPNLAVAIRVFSALEIYGAVYVRGPEPADLNPQEAVASIEFPRQALEYRAGDDRDLSVLLAALLESAGVETAFVTAPGRINLAFCLAASPEQARKLFTQVDDLVFRGSTSWIALDVTQIGNGFESAWQSGAKGWRESAARNQAGFFPLHEAWQEYEPAQLPGGASISMPASDEVISAFQRQAEQIQNVAAHGTPR